MKLKNILAMPFAIAADIASLGNMGGPSFTQQLINKDSREQSEELLVELLKAMLKK